MKRRRASRLLPLVWLVFASSAWAEEASVSPYIDELKAEAKVLEKKSDTVGAPQPTDANPQPYIDSLKKGMTAESLKEEPSYTEDLKKQLGAESDSQGYTDREKAKLGPDTREGAIEAVSAGRSDLKAKREGEIHNAVGLRIGSSLTRDITSAMSLQPFQTIYGSNTPVEGSLFYEYQPWHSEWFGNIGLFGQVGVGYYHGAGTYQFTPNNADKPGTNFGTTSGTQFQFFTAPITVGIDYRFNLARLIRPFVMAGGTVVALYEDRNDGGDAHISDARGLYVSGGANILMDWISPKATWDLYAEHHILHYYLTIEYSQIVAISGPVSVTASGVYGGFTFEF